MRQRRLTNFNLNLDGVPTSMQDFDWINEHISRLPTGNYTVKEMFPIPWDRFHRQSHYGKWFKRHVRLGLIKGVRINRQRSNKSWEYTVYRTDSSKFDLSIEVA